MKAKDVIELALSEVGYLGKKDQRQALRKDGEHLLSAAGLTSNTKYLPCTGLHIVANTLTTIMTGIYLDGSTIKANGINVADGSTTASTFLIVVIRDTVVEI